MAQFFIVLLFLVAVFGMYLYERFRNTEEEDKLDEANQEIGQLKQRLSETMTTLEKATSLAEGYKADYEKVRFNKISSEVKLGQKAEHLLPFLETFPYKDDEIKGLFQPIDLIVFRDDEVVFVEIKTGAAGLSEKERRIRDNIKAGRVRFEVHRMNEKGVSVK